MKTMRTCIRPLSAFGTPPKGDTLFGQLCWAIRNCFSEERLIKLLEGYLEGCPFAVLSDAFPVGFFPCPALPGHWFGELVDIDRKEAKKRIWLPEKHCSEPVREWLKLCRKADSIPGGAFHARPQPHNQIDRRTGTTGEGFAPYIMTQYWYRSVPAGDESGMPSRLTIYVVYDEERITSEELGQLFADVGEIGFGRDASIGLGKFSIESFENCSLPMQPDSNVWMTLAPCAPQGMDLDPGRSFYKVFVRFGRHGDVAGHADNPFKSPVLLCQTAAVLTPRHYETRSFAGQGLGGEGTLSKAIPDTVNQGYAPVLGIRLQARKEGAK